MNQSTVVPAVLLIPKGFSRLHMKTRGLQLVNSHRGELCWNTLAKPTTESTKQKLPFIQFCS